MFSFDPIYKNSKLEIFTNPSVDTQAEYPKHLQDIFSQQICQDAIAEISQWQDYQQSPLVSLTNVATELALTNIYYKDESERFGLGSFKALGGAYAVLYAVTKQLKNKYAAVTFADIRQGKYADELKKITVVTATDGNHGRSVAWGAQQFGCKCVIYIHAEVSEGRKTAMEAYGAEVIRVHGNYDDSVRAAEKKRASGWLLVSDTSYHGYTELPRHVMAGYTLMMAETLQQLTTLQTSVTHIFVQGGCGGLPGAVCGYLWQQLGATRPRFSIVEPIFADCLIKSAKQGSPAVVNITTESIMAGLSCGEVSTIAWEILAAGCSDFITIEDNIVAPSMNLLADNAASQPVVGGESAVAGLAALIAICQDDTKRQQLNLQPDSKILLLGTEGATDPVIYEALVGRSADIVRNSR